MPKRHHTLTLFVRLRRASALRVVLVVAAVLASQNSLACAFEELAGAQGTEIVASEGADTSAEGSDQDCCTLCLDCANCGACHGSAVSPRASNGDLSFRSNDAKFTVESSAPELWTPPALLRPPIDVA